MTVDTEVAVAINGPSNRAVCRGKINWAIFHAAYSVEDAHEAGSTPRVVCYHERYRAIKLMRKEERSRWEESEKETQ